MDNDKKMKKNTAKFIITAGGTGGHIYPALAIAQELSARNCEVLFVGNRDSMEEKIITASGIPFAAIDVRKLYRSLTSKHLLFPWKLMKSILISGSLIKNFQPDACIGTGGFVSFPIIFRAAMSKIPVYIQEQNSAPGLTTRILSRFARHIFIGFEDATLHLPSKKCILTGNPVRKDLEQESSRIRKHVKNSMSILIIGGSQGAKTINDATLDLLPMLLSQSKSFKYHIYWQCGKGNFEELKKSLSEIVWHKEPQITYNETGDFKNLSAPDTHKHSLVLFPFTGEMSNVYNATEIAITRAGAISLAELEVKKIPAVIIPIPNSAGNHQYLNAKAQVSRGLGVLLEQPNLSTQTLHTAIGKLADNFEDYINNFNTVVRTENSVCPHKHTGAAKIIADTIIKSTVKDQPISKD